MLKPSTIAALAIAIFLAGCNFGETPDPFPKRVNRDVAAEQACESLLGGSIRIDDWQMADCVETDGELLLKFEQQPRLIARRDVAAEQERRSTVDDALAILDRAEGLPDEADEEIDELAAELKAEIRQEIESALQDFDFDRWRELLEILSLFEDRRTRWLAFSRLIAWYEGSRRTVDPAEEEFRIEFERL